MRAIGLLTSQPHLEAEVVVQRLDQLETDAFEKLVSR
jgi:hypothetical protein